MTQQDSFSRQPNRDLTASSRKLDHIELAFNSQIAQNDLDQRFSYEPLLAAHPAKGSYPATTFLGKQLRLPMWVSSMTGGTGVANTINHNLARACGEFGMGMGLGSCRQLLHSNEYFDDFNVRPVMGDEVPLFANLGIAQVEELIEDGQLDLVNQLVDKLRADGLILHVNPFQEWLQPEGDRFKRPPLEVIQQTLEETGLSIVVKEVGQGMGEASLRALLQLPIAAIDFAANGGTNFAKLELLRSDETKRAVYGQLANVGHSALEMVYLVNALREDLGDRVQCHEVIISGGIQTFLDGYYLVRTIGCSAIYGKASAFLRHARGDYELLREYVATQQQGLELANAFLVPVPLVG